MTADAPPPSPSAFAGEPDEAEKVAPEIATFRLPETPSVKPSGSGYGNTPPVADASQPSDKDELHVLEKVQWEAKADGSFEAWHAPNGSKSPRKEKTYLGRVGKRLLAKWGAMPPDERRAAVVAEWIADRRREKGME